MEETEQTIAGVISGLTGSKATARISLFKEENVVHSAVTSEQQYSLSLTLNIEPDYKESSSLPSS